MRASVPCWLCVLLFACTSGGDDSSSKHAGSRAAESATRDEPAAGDATGEEGRGAESTSDEDTSPSSSGDGADSDTPAAETSGPDAGPTTPEGYESGARPHKATPQAGSAAPPRMDMDMDAETNEMCILHGMYWPRLTDPDGAEGCRGGTTKRESLDEPAPASN